MDDRFVAVYRAPNESSARIVQMALESAGIPAVSQGKYGSLVYDGVIAMAEGYWGEVLVEEKNAAEAERVLREYSEEKKETNGEDQVEV